MEPLLETRTTLAVLPQTDKLLKTIPVIFMNKFIN